MGRGRVTRSPERPLVKRQLKVGSRPSIVQKTKSPAPLRRRRDRRS